MIGLVLVTHGALAVEFKSALEHVVGPQEQIETVCIGPDDDMEARREDIITAVGAANTGSGVVILTDMFGGTPSNLAISVMKTVCIGPDDDMGARREDIITAVGAANTGSGVVILTDMFGGTPSNLAISVMKTVGAEVIAGVNLPMLVKLARVRGDLEIKAAVSMAAEAGRKYINVASESLGG